MSDAPDLTGPDLTGPDLTGPDLTGPDLTEPDPTELDLAHAAMEAAPDDDLARLRFHERLADSELFLLLTGEPTGDDVEPQILDSDEGRFVLVFDREARLAAFAGQIAPMAALSGRGLAGMLAGQGLGLALNLGVAPSAMLVGSAGVDWLVTMLAAAPVLASGQPVGFEVPRGVPEALLLGLDRKLAMAAGLARTAWLAGATYADGSRRHMLLFVGALPEAETALAAAVAEALQFSGIEAGALDVAFLAATDRRLSALARVGLRFDLPQPLPMAAPPPPGMDPDRPPRLR